MFKVMTLNCNYYVDKHGVWEKRRELIIETIRTLKPDLIALQAIEKNYNLHEGTDQATQIALFCGFPYVHFVPAEHFSKKNLKGQAILSQNPFKILETSLFSLRCDHQDQTKRMAMAVSLDFDQGVFHLFNAHLSWVPVQTADNIQELRPFLNRYQGLRMLVGDFNAEIKSGLFDPMFREGWIDGWHKIYTGKEGFTFESDNPSIRIDYA